MRFVKTHSARWLQSSYNKNLYNPRAISAQLHLFFSKVYIPYIQEELYV